MNVLLIDDEASRGWKEILEKVLFNGEPISVAFDESSAKILLHKTEYDLIILDLRFGEVDYASDHITHFGGYKILKNFIRNSFRDKNFSTPVLLLTASNKAWNIVEMLENGVDDFYIKEHPNTASDLDFSRQNYKRLKESIPILINMGLKRKEIWLKIQTILNQISKGIVNNNIKKRIEEKLIIAYGSLFRRTSQLEKNNLLFNNEIIAFIVFWSILEEISHEYYSRKTEDDIKWVIASNNEIIQYIDSDEKVYSRFPSIKEEFIKNEEINSVFANQVNLSNQIVGILRFKLGWSHHRVRTDFLEKLNRYRNKIDFIHSSTTAILSDNLKSHENSAEGYKKINTMLDFIIEILT